MEIIFLKEAPLVELRFDFDSSNYEEIVYKTWCEEISFKGIQIIWMRIIVGMQGKQPRFILHKDDFETIVSSLERDEYYPPLWRSNKIVELMGMDESAGLYDDANQ